MPFSLVPTRPVTCPGRAHALARAQSDPYRRKPRLVGALGFAGAVVLNLVMDAPATLAAMPGGTELLDLPFEDLLR